MNWQVFVQIICTCQCSGADLLSGKPLANKSARLSIDVSTTNNVSHSRIRNCLLTGRSIAALWIIKSTPALRKNDSAFSTASLRQSSPDAKSNGKTFTPSGACLPGKANQIKREERRAVFKKLMSSLQIKNRPVSCFLTRSNSASLRAEIMSLAPKFASCLARTSPSHHHYRGESEIVCKWKITIETYSVRMLLQYLGSFHQI